MDAEVPDTAPGWNAIDARLGRLYGEEEPRHYGTLLSYSLGGPDPLDGISAYKRRDPRPHWHFITYGFSELYEKEWDDPEVSGYGFELTFRLGCPLEQEDPPPWTLNFLQNLARYVFSTGNRFSSGDHMNLNGPIALGTDSTIVAVGFLEDPELEPVHGPNGKLDFLQVTGLTHDEFLAVQRSNTASFLRVLSRRNPLLVTDLERRSILLQPDVEREVAAGSRSEGSSTGYLFTDALSWRITAGSLGGEVLVRLGANPARAASEIVLGRVPHGRDFTLGGKEQSLTLLPDERGSWEVQDDHLKIGLAQGQALELSRRLGEGVGSFAVEGLEGVRFEVVVSRIKDPSGKIVGEVG